MEIQDIDEKDIEETDIQRKKRNTCMIICIILLLILMLPSTLAFFTIF
jgi:hypothetical protein